jgi:hypothetical protein
VTTVRGRDGGIWEVRRTLGWPRWRKLRVSDRLDLADGLDLVGQGLSATGTFGELVFLIALTVAIGLFIAVFLPLVLFVVELLVLVPAVLLVFRPWRVIATTAGPPPERLEWRVRGWRGSREAVEEVARELGHGVSAAPENAE